MSKKKNSGIDIQKAGSSRSAERNQPSSRQVQSQQSTPADDPSLMALGGRNFRFILIGVFFIALGFILMATESFIDATQFSKALYISPPLIILGHVIVVYGLLIKPEKTSGTQTGTEAYADGNQNSGIDSGD